jgi:hypothetical protein
MMQEKLLWKDNTDSNWAVGLDHGDLYDVSRCGSDSSRSGQVFDQPESGYGPCEKVNFADHDEAYVPVK